MRHGNADAVALPHLDSRPSQGNGSKNRLQVIPDIVVSVGEVVERQGIGSHSWDPPSDPRSACKRLGTRRKFPMRTRHLTCHGSAISVWQLIPKRSSCQAGFGCLSPPSVSKLTSSTHSLSLTELHSSLPQLYLSQQCSISQPTPPTRKPAAPKPSS